MAKQRQPHTRPAKYFLWRGAGGCRIDYFARVECLRQADVVLYDYLVNPAILRHVKPQAELVCLGGHRRDAKFDGNATAARADQNRIWKQSEINERLIDLAHAGSPRRAVERGRSGRLRAAGRGDRSAGSRQIEYEIVPGVTAGLAASSYAGIRITQRDVASAVAW